MKTLIITNSYDVTTDLLIHYIGPSKIFRLNFDLLSDYSIFINTNDFLIRSPKKQIKEQEISKVYWRKPFHVNQTDSEYEYQERKQIIRQIYNILFAQGKAILVNPYKEFSTGKILQLRIAKDYFQIPNWEVILNHESNFSECITKSLSSTIIDEKYILYATRINTKEIDLSESWLLQEYIDKEKELTVVYINSKIFAFELEPTPNMVDWKQGQLSHRKEWKSHKVPQELRLSIVKFMSKMKLDYGRLDFVISKGIYYFLEVNINGQWAFLDYENLNGLFAEMTTHIDPLTKTKFLT